VEKKPEFGIHCRTILRLLCGVSQINEHRARHEKVSDKCTCNGDVETVQHMLFKCDLTHCIRDTLWEKIELNAPIGLCRELLQMDIDVRTIFLLSAFKCKYVNEWERLYEAVAMFITVLYDKRCMERSEPL